jgi:dipeptidyl aminopeptidase/acylaminoacyl peptidase
MSKRLIAVALTVAVGALIPPAGIRAQQAPAAQPDVYLAPLLQPNRGPLTIGPLVNISNGPDYDNQPSFLPDSSAVLFSSKRDGKQNDIYRYDIATKALTQLTHTPESEFSPLVTPDGKTFSVVRVEADGTQRLWRFDLDGTNPKLVIANTKQVAYYVWIDPTHVAVYVLVASDAPSTLQVVDTTTGASKVIDSDIGHTLLIDPKSHLLTYVKKKSNGNWAVEQSDPSSADTYLVNWNIGAPETEDFAFVSDEMAFISHESRIWLSGLGVTKNPPPGPSFEFINFTATIAADFTGGPVKNITRLAVSPDGKWIAIVAEPVAK